MRVEIASEGVVNWVGFRIYNTGRAERHGVCGFQSRWGGFRGGGPTRILGGGPRPPRDIKNPHDRKRKLKHNGKYLAGFYRELVAIMGGL